MAEVKEDILSKRDFSKVILTLENVLIPEDKLSPTPSVQDGLDFEDELDLRILGCELVQTAGHLLKLPQVAMAAGQVLFQRFYYSKSFVKHSMEILAMACINLAAKIEEAPRRIRDVVNVFHHIRQVKLGKNIAPLILDQNYVNLKNQVIKAERRVLKELGFCVHVKHPHKIIVMYLQVLECENNQQLVQKSWNYMNDSFRTNAFVRFHPETIACACIYLAARQLNIPLPTSPPWFDIFMVEEADIKEVVVSILKLYERKKPDFEKLEGKVNDLKKVHIEAKLKMKGGLASDVGTPNSGSRPNTPSKNSPSIQNPALKKIKDEEARSDRSFGDGLYKNGAKKHQSPDSPHHRDRGRSVSGSPRSGKSGSYSSRSGSRGTRSPTPDKRRHSPKRSKKSSYYSSKSRKNQRQSRKRRHSRSYSRSRSRSPSRSPIYASSRLAKKSYKDRRRSPSRSYSRSLSVSPVRRNTSKSHKKSYYKEKHRSRSRSRSYERVKSNKKHNGHHRSYSGERYRR